MKIAIIYMSDIKYAPFIEKYAEIFRENNIEYDVIFWNREIAENRFPSNYKVYRNPMRMDLPKEKKLKGFLGFRRYCKSCIKEEKYNKIVALTTLSAFFLFDILIWKYPKRYIFDIRDFSYENIRWFKIIESWLIKKSEYTVISSPYFKEFLMENYEYLLCHNHNRQDDNVVKKAAKRKEDKINVGFVGSMRYFDHQKYIIDALSDDDRFILSYYGTGPEYDKFLKYKTDKNISNMFLYGSYDYREIGRILEEIDILNNSYGYVDDCLNPEIRYAISNKYYSGLQWKIPQLVETGSYKCKQVERLNVGIGIDIKDADFADKLYDYYLTYDEDILFEQSEAELQRINEEERMFYSHIEEFVKDGSDDE